MKMQTYQNPRGQIAIMHKGRSYGLLAHTSGAWRYFPTRRTGKIGLCISRKHQPTNSADLAVEQLKALWAEVDA